MRLNKFESAGSEPLGEGDEKKVFVDPKNETRVISERKDAAGKDTPRQLKGRYYLGKIAHALLPGHIPDIYQAGESVDGKQTVDIERIPHSAGQALLQKLRRASQNEEPAREKLEEERLAMRGLDDDLEKIGFGFALDQNAGNYTKDEAGSTYYLETFKPWRADDVDPKELEVLFDEEALREAIDELPDEKARDECFQHLERLLALLGEEKKDTKELQENRESSLLDCKPGIEKFEATIAPFLEEQVLASLHEITSYKTVAEILSNEERNRAKEACDLVFSQLKFLQEKTNITAEDYKALYEKYMTIRRAVGVLNGGIVDHTR
jgi:hypothetical protein